MFPECRPAVVVYLLFGHIFISTGKQTSILMLLVYSQLTLHPCSCLELCIAIIFTNAVSIFFNHECHLTFITVIIVNGYRIESYFQDEVSFFFFLLFSITGRKTNKSVKRRPNVFVLFVLCFVICFVCLFVVLKFYI